MRRYSLSVIIPAYNEEKGVAGAVKSVVDAVIANQNKINDYEILLIDNGSNDKTGEIVDSLAKYNHKIKPMHIYPNQGFGHAFLTGAGIAKMEYTVFVPGDNEISAESIRNIFARVGDADIVAACHSNLEVRPFIRRFLSVWYDRVLNLMFGLNLRYYNGPNIIQTSLLKVNLPSTVGFAFATEIMVKLLKWHKLSYIHVEMKVQPTGHTSIFKIKNIISVVTTIIRLFFKIHFGKKPEL